MEAGLVESRQEFILPDDAYPFLQNAYVWREQLKRRAALQILDRLRRNLTGQALGVTDGLGVFTGNIKAILSLEANSDFEIGTISITVGAQVFVETAALDGTLTNGAAGTGSINYSTGALVINTDPPLAATPVTAAFSYFPLLPVMGLREREVDAFNNEDTIAFDTKYAYQYIGGWQEFIPGTTWTGSNSDFFWTTNYWVGDGNLRIFWATNFSGTGGDPIRYTNGTAWADFAPQINAAGDLLTQCLAMLPFRGRMVTFNTYEGGNLATSVNMPQRIRWAQIGNPFTTVSPIVSTVVANAWRDDIRGKGGFLDIPTTEAIVAVGFVRDNLVIYCERSTWQLRYTGRSIAPFQIEKVNTELGAESTFSAVQFDTSLVGIGDKGIVECDSFKSEKIDIKIPDLVFQFNNQNDGVKRVYGIRDIQQRLCYWTYPYSPDNKAGSVYPNRRLVYNYENDSWAIFTDSLTCFGTFQSQSDTRWIDCDFTWAEADFTWVNRPAAFPSIIAGNQQGYTLYLGTNLDELTTNDPTLYIQNITGNTTTATVVNSPDHNLDDNQIIKITDIPAGTPFATSLNNNKFSIIRVDKDNFELWKYNSSSGEFSTPQVDPPGVYVGGGQISVRDNFSITSKKFNFLDQGQNIQMGYLDVLMNNTSSGAVTMNVYLDYNNDSPINISPQNSANDGFFNSIVPTSQTGVGISSSKNWNRVFCPVRGNFVTIEWTLSNAQMIGIEQESDVQIDSQILWIRPAGKQLPLGV